MLVKKIILLLLEVVIDLREKVTMGHLGDRNMFAKEVVTQNAKLMWRTELCLNIWKASNMANAQLTGQLHPNCTWPVQFVQIEPNSHVLFLSFLLTFHRIGFTLRRKPVNDTDQTSCSKWTDCVSVCCLSFGDFLPRFVMNICQRAAARERQHSRRRKWARSVERRKIKCQILYFAQIFKKIPLNISQWPSVWIFSGPYKSEKATSISYLKG